MNRTSSYREPRICDICHTYRGGKSDHTKCSAERKLRHGDSCIRKHPNKKLTEKQTRQQGAYYSENY